MTEASALARSLTPRLNRYIQNYPHAKQAAFLLLPQREALFGGAAGGGKSDALLMAALQYFDVPGYSALILRTTKQSLTLPSGLIPRSHAWLAGTGAVWKSQENTWYSPEGATITFGYLKHPDDKYRYASSEYQFIGFEELTEFKREDDYRFMFSRLRRPVGTGELSRVPLRVRSTTNPVGPGYSWVKARFVDVPTTRDRVFLPSTVEDNPSLDTAEYEEALSVLPPVLQQKLRRGDWSAIEKGEFFDRDDIMVETPPLDFEKQVLFWDLAATKPSPENPDPDYTCGVHLAKDFNDRFWILGVHMVRENPSGVQFAVKRAVTQTGTSVYHRMFKDPAQAGKDQALNYARLLAGYDFGAVPISGNVLTLIAGVSAQSGNGNLYMAPGIGSAVGEFLDQLEGLPYGTHDDAPAALGGAFNFLLDARPKRRRKPVGKRVY